MLKIVLVAAGGALGSLLRYGLHTWVQRTFGGAFPWGTFTVNVLGCLAAGVLAAALAAPGPFREEYRLGLMVGFLGGFTTFSAFGLETFHLASGGQIRLALANVIASSTMGLVAVWIGFRLTQRWLGA